MKQRLNKQALANYMAQNMTDSERRLWSRLRSLRFRPQKVICGYIADFAHPAKRLVIEVDGSVHIGREEYDSTRDSFLEAAGWRVVRFSNEAVDVTLDQVVDAIGRALALPRLPRVRWSSDRPQPRIGDAVHFGCAVRKWKRLHPPVQPVARLVRSDRGVSK